MFHLEQTRPGNAGPVNRSVDDDWEDELQGGHHQGAQQGDEEVEVWNPGRQETGETHQGQPDSQLPADPVVGGSPGLDQARHKDRHQDVELEGVGAGDGQHDGHLAGQGQQLSLG